MRSTHFLLAALLVLSSLGPAAAQDALPRHITTSIGLFQYELSRNGLAPMVAIRATAPASSVLVLEGGVIASRPQQQVGGSTTFLAPEAQAQLVLPFDRILPYMGLGAGAVIDFRSEQLGGTYADFSVSGSLGVRAWVLNRGGIQMEFRGRGIGADFAETSSEYTAGMIWRF
jgi:hypothetical protein